MKAEKAPLIFTVSALPGEEGALIKLLLYNNSDMDKNITFNSSQMFDFTIKNKAGKVVYQYSHGKAFLQALQSLSIKKGEVEIWKETWDYKENGKRVPEGQYTIQAQLLGESLSEFNLPLRATHTFTVPEENPAFRAMKVREVKGRVIVQGEARVSDGSFYYDVEDGHRVLLKETIFKVNKEAPNWTEFTLILPELKGRKGKVFLSLYERDSEDGKIKHRYVISIP
ncbi:hypothetical protein HF072_11915 [Bacillus sp. RO3]|nr:hypothetical protein [Bacillus sp. RO3]